MAVVFVAAIFSLARMETPVNSRQDKPAEQPARSAQAKEFSGFSFYALLKDFEIEVPETTAKATSSANAVKSSYVIQAGSFKTATQAESRLAELILLGLEPTVGEVTNANGERWHRVLLGPYNSRSQMASARSVIISNNIEAMVMQRKQR
ncbi:MAG: SPOR domain-containing protein [Gammaproteobacteria bacterium]|nr:SPOR domain-containing protein [Gammaproteobacteria bacterium]